MLKLVNKVMLLSFVSLSFSVDSYSSSNSESDPKEISVRDKRYIAEKNHRFRRSQDKTYQDIKGFEGIQRRGFYRYSEAKENINNDMKRSGTREIFELEREVIELSKSNCEQIKGPFQKKIREKCLSLYAQIKKNQLKLEKTNYKLELHLRKLERGFVRLENALGVTTQTICFDKHSSSKGVTAVADTKGDAQSDLINNKFFGGDKSNIDCFEKVYTKDDRVKAILHDAASGKSFIGQAYNPKAAKENARFVCGMKTSNRTNVLRQK